MGSTSLDIPSNNGQDESDDDEDTFYVANCNLTKRHATVDFDVIDSEVNPGSPASQAASSIPQERSPVSITASPVSNGQSNAAEKYMRDEQLTRQPCTEGDESFDEQSNIQNDEVILPPPRHGGQLVKLLIHNGAISFREFKCVDGSYAYKNSRKVYKVPVHEKEALATGYVRKESTLRKPSAIKAPVIKPKPQLNSIKTNSRHIVMFKGTIRGHWDGKKNRGVWDDENAKPQPEVVVPRKRGRLKILSRSLLLRVGEYGFYSRGFLLALGLCLCFSVPITIVLILLFGLRASYDGW